MVKKDSVSVYLGYIIACRKSRIYNGSNTAKKEACTCKHSVLISVWCISQHVMEEESKFNEHQEACHIVWETQDGNVLNNIE